MFINLDQFNRELQDYVKTIPPQEANKLARVLAMEGLTRVVMKTPVDRSHARMNWQVQVGPGDNRELSTPFQDTDGSDPAQGNMATSQAINEGASVINSAPPYSLVTIFNNVPYILVLEEGGFIPPNPGPSRDPRPHRKGRIWVQSGFSVQAPQGMVMLTVTELRSIFP